MTSPDEQQNENAKKGQHEPASEETKQKFREALENKKNQHHGSVQAANGTKINHQAGAASQKREFRRKSG